MKDDFSINFHLDAILDEENVRRITRRVTALGLSHRDTEENIIKRVLGRKKLLETDMVIPVEGDSSWLRLCMGPYRGFDILLDGYSYAWKKDYKHWCLADNSSATRLLINICQDFILKYVAILPEEPLLIDRPIDKGSIAAEYALGNRDSYENDIYNIVRRALCYGYTFVHDITSMKTIEAQKVSEAFVQGMKENMETSTYLVVEGFVSLFKISGGLGILTPQEPFCIKHCGEKIGVDLAFYAIILLNLGEDFGMYEMRSNF